MGAAASSRRWRDESQGEPEKSGQAREAGRAREREGALDLGKVRRVPQLNLGGGVSGDWLTPHIVDVTTKKIRGALGRGGSCTTGASTASSFAIAVGSCFFRSSFRPSFTVWQSSQGCAPSNVLATATLRESCCAKSTTIFVHATVCSTAQCPPRICTAAMRTKNLARRVNKRCEGGPPSDGLASFSCRRRCRLPGTQARREFGGSLRQNANQVQATPVCSTESTASTIPVVSTGLSRYPAAPRRRSIRSTMPSW